MRFDLISLCIVDSLMQRSIKIKVIWKICSVHVTIGMFEICSVYVTIGMFENFWIQYEMFRNQK